MVVTWRLEWPGRSVPCCHPTLLWLPVGTAVLRYCVRSGAARSRVRHRRWRVGTRRACAQVRQVRWWAAPCTPWIIQFPLGVELNHNEFKPVHDQLRCLIAWLPRHRCHHCHRCYLVPRFAPGGGGANAALCLGPKNCGTRLISSKCLIDSTLEIMLLRQIWRKINSQ